MKTLKDELSEVMNSNLSKRLKKEAIIKLGIREKEANFLLHMTGVSKACKFNATSLTFGVEIECYNVSTSSLIDSLREKRINCAHEGYNHDTRKHFKLVRDASITGTNPIECVSPILKGKSGLEDLKNVCESLNSVGAKVNKSTGLHIHFDASKLSDKHFVRVFTNYARLESVIDSFMPLSRRDNNNTFCRSLLSDLPLLKIAENKQRVINILNCRYYKVNAQSYLRYKTVEFRQHSGTTDFEKISNWINFLRKLIQYSFEKDITTCNSIAEIPFLTDSEKQYFTNRKNNL